MAFRQDVELLGDTLVALGARDMARRVTALTCVEEIIEEREHRRLKLAADAFDMSAFEDDQ
jgi:hypothetical protein